VRGSDGDVRRRKFVVRERRTGVAARHATERSSTRDAAMEGVVEKCGRPDSSVPNGKAMLLRMMSAEPVRGFVACIAPKASA
jgi:hypothetical protein